MTTEPKRYTTENPLKILSLGWGVQSWTLAAMAALGEIPKPDFAVHSDTTHEMIEMTTVVGLVIMMGDLCYKDKTKFPNGPWCKEGNWVLITRYAGSRIKIDGGELRIVNDDEILAVIDDPRDILPANIL